VLLESNADLDLASRESVAKIEPKNSHGLLPRAGKHTYASHWARVNNIPGTQFGCCSGTSLTDCDPQNFIDTYRTLQLNHRLHDMVHPAA